MKQNLVITIDGPAGSGKSTLARLLEERNAFTCINSGALYRAATFLLYCLRGVEEAPTAEIILATQNHQSNLDYIIKHFIPMMRTERKGISFSQALTIEGKSYLFLTEDQLFTPAIDTNVSMISTYAPLRHSIVKQIRSFTSEGKWVVEGRDAGSQICPDAAVKFYLDAELEERIARRIKQYQTSNSTITESERNSIRAQLEERDRQDSNKGIYSLKKESCVHCINSSGKSIEQIYTLLYTKLEYAMEERENNKVIDLNIPSDFEAMIDSSFQKLHDVQNIHKGDIIDGKIVKITDTDVFVDLGLKTEERISINEFENAKLSPKLGESIQVYVVRNNMDNLSVSFTRALELRSIKELQNSFENNLPIMAVVKTYVPNGFLVDILHSIQAFVPISQMDVSHVSEKQVKNYLDKEFEFVILELYRNKKLQPILSRRKLLLERNSREKEEFMSKHKEGDIVKGTVKTFTSFGVFVDLGGFDALLHISDISWKRNVRPTEIIRKNKTYEFKVIKIDPKEKKISLSLKDMQENPWDTIEKHYPVGTIIHGEVTKVLSYGAFVSIDQEVEGFIHISELSWLKHIKHPSELLKQGSIAKCKVLYIDKEKQRVSLGIKQVERDPWTTVDSLYPVGYKLTLPIKKVTQYGLILEFEEGYKGFIARDNMSWNKKKAITYHKGEKVECIILSHDKEMHQINLGIKQLSENPWESGFFTVGKIVEGTITTITDFGIFVKFPNEIEGLIPKNKTYDHKKHSSYEEVRSNFKSGQKIQSVVMAIQKKEGKLLLSIQALKEMIDKAELDKHMVSDVESERAMSLGDMIVNDKIN